MSSIKNSSQKLLIISYNEGKQEFNNNDLTEIINEIKQSLSDYIIICTQQSKIYVREQKQQHMSYLLGESLKQHYIEIYKKNSSLLSSTIEGSCLRMSIYQNKNIKEKEILNIKSKLRSNIIGQASIATTNNQAMYLELTINSRKIIILNTELLTLDSINFGESRRELEFLSLVKEFELHKKYNEKYNIIICGSLNFRLKNMYKIINNSLRVNLFNIFQNSIQENSNNQKIQKNQLKIYLNQLIEELNHNQTKSTKSDPNITIIKLYDINTMYSNLFKKFSESIITVGFHKNCGFPEGNNKRQQLIINSSKKATRESGSSAIGVFIPMISAIKNISIALISNQVLGTGQKDIDRAKKNFKLPAMCDKIIFALQDDIKKNISYIDKSFKVLDKPTKSNRRIICATFIIFP